MTVLPFPEWRPDLSSNNPQFTNNILNVLPRGDGYGPFPGFNGLSTALAAVCRGFFFARNADASITIFAATSTKIYKMSNTDFTWTDVSKGSGTYSAVPTADQWQFAQFNNFVIAVQINTVSQVFDLTSSTNFADLGGSPPQARYIAIVNRFVVLSGLGSSTPYRIQWSGLNATTTWTSGVNSSDFQDFPDGGPVRGVAGGEYGIITQDSSIRMMTYTPGSPVIFTINRIVKDKGIFAPLSLVTAGDRVFYCASDGFQMLVPGGYPQPIGIEKVNRFLLGAPGIVGDIDAGSLQYFIGASDPRTTRVYWSYKSINGPSGAFDKILIYDWSLDRFTPTTISGQYLTTLGTPGLTLENLDTISASIDALTFSLDDVSTGALAKLSAASTSNVIGFYSGAPLEATIETSEQGGNQRLYVSGFRPVCDAPAIFGSISRRETTATVASHTAERPVDARGICPADVSTRYARGKMRIPAATIWTYASGVEPMVQPDGEI